MSRSVITLCLFIQTWTALGQNAGVRQGQVNTVMTFVDSGSTDTYVVATPAFGSCPASYAVPLGFWFVPNTLNTGAASLNICSLGVLPIKAADGTSDPTTADLKAGAAFWLKYDSGSGGFFRMQSSVGEGGSVFTGSTATAPAFSATPTFSLADVTSGKSPKCFEPGAMTASVTSVTFSNKSAGAEFCIVWVEGGAGNFTVTYGASASNTCIVKGAATYTLTQHFRVAADGTTVKGLHCNVDGVDYTELTAITAPGTPDTGTGRQYVDSTSKTLKNKDDAGVVSSTVVAKDCNALSAGDLMKSVDANGVPQCATPAVTALTGCGATANQFVTVVAAAGCTKAQPTEANLSTSDITTNDCTTSKHGLTPKAPNDVTKFLNGLCAWSVPAGGSSAVSPGGSALYGDLGAGTTYTPSSGAAKQMSYTLFEVPGPGWNLASVKWLVNSATTDRMTGCVYDLPGNLVTNGQGSTASTAGNATWLTVTFSSLGLTAGPYLLGLTSDNSGGTTTLYTGRLWQEGWSQQGSNNGKGSSTYVFFRGPTGSNLATGTTTLTCPATVGTRTSAAGTNAPVAIAD